MLKPSRLFLLTALLLTLSVSVSARTHASVMAGVFHLPALSAATPDTDRDRDGLSGPVRRVKTETAKLLPKGDQLVEGPRQVLETASYDMKGAKIDYAFFPTATDSLTGKEVYKYDDKGNIAEMTLLHTNGSVLSKETYHYEFDKLGNWTKMTTLVAVVENGQMTFEPKETTYRSITYYLGDSVAKVMQPGDDAAAASAAAPPPAPAAAEIKPSVTPVKMEVVANAAPSGLAVGSAMPNNTATNNAASGATTKNPAATKNTTAPAANGTAKPGAAAPAAATVTAAPPLSTSVSTASNLTLKATEPIPSASQNIDAPTAEAAKPLRGVPVKPISGGVLNGKALELPKPDYPEMARRARASGLVTVEVVIDVNGKVISAKAVSGPSMLQRAAEQAARRARFTPTLLSGQPVKMTGSINYNFMF